MPKAIRDVYGQTLLELGGTNPDVVVLDADLSGSTKSAMFGKAYPERFFNMGIAEANMVSTAAGLAAAGKIPFVNTFTCFLSTFGLIATKVRRPGRGFTPRAGGYSGHEIIAQHGRVVPIRRAVHPGDDKMGM
jgi:transketolase